jgi:hypothetical protein
MGFKNRIINGAMVIDQRNAGAAITPVNIQYSVDRWQSFVSAASKFTIQQNAGAITPPAGFTNYLGATSSSAYSLAAGDYFTIQQRIEGYNVSDLNFGKASAATITVSFWVRSSLTGTFGGAISNNAQNRGYPFTYTISSANTWEQKSVTIAGDTTGTWETTSNNGMFVIFSLGTGTTYSGTAGAWAGSALLSATGATSVVGTNGATFYITGVQLEKGSTATSFDYRPYGTELALCQRYFEKSYDTGTAPTTITGSGAVYVTATSDSAGSFVVSVPFASVKRAVPTITFYNANSGASGTWRYARSGVAETDYSMTSLFVGARAFNCYGNIGANWTPAYEYGHWIASAEL